MAGRGRDRALWRAGAILGIAALLLQVTALLAHHLGSPHTHRVAQQWQADETAPLGTDHPAADHAPADRGAPAQDLPSCPVWTALQALGGFVAPAQAAFLLVAWIIVDSLSAPPTPAFFRRTIGSAQPRAPPALG